MPEPICYAVVPAGGAGTRLWPLSRATRPKFLLDLTGSGSTLLQQTWDRLAPLVDDVLVVTGTAHADAVASQLSRLDPDNLLLEPSPRDSMAAIGLAAAVLVARHPDDDVVIGSFAADHTIADQAALSTAVRQAIEIARRDLVVTIGIEADHPSTAFGYIELGQALDVDGDDATGARAAFSVAAFTEKPDEQTAAQYLQTGRYRWNAGMYVMRARVLLSHLARFQPTMHDGLLAIAAAWDGPERAAVLADRWPGLTKIAIDHAISEPLSREGGIAVVPADLGWNDVGDWRSLAQITAANSQSVHILGEHGLVHAVDAEGAVVVPAGKTVVLLGVPGAVVVDTADALLVASRERAQDVKEVVAWLQANGRADLL